VRFPFNVKVIFGIGAVTTPSGQSRPLAKVYIASATEQTAPFLEAPGDAILLNGLTQNARRGGEIGGPGFQADLFFAATVLFRPS
jgi:hypothetical protein